MLVLARKNKESVILEGGDGPKHLVRVTVIRIGPGVVKLGFEAKKNILVNREEIWKRLLRESEDGTSNAPHDALGRWADDGGRSDQVETVLKDTNFGRQAPI